MTATQIKIEPKSLEIFSDQFSDNIIQEPPEGMELVDGKLVEKTGMTLRHARTQSKLDCYWRNYSDSSHQGGEVFTEASCRTAKQIRRPDVAYLTPDLFKQFASYTVLPQSFPLIAEIASPDDSAEELFKKAKEYLESGCQEVWLIFPESLWIIILTADKHLLLTLGEVATTQTVLTGFSISVDELLALGIENNA